MLLVVVICLHIGLGALTRIAYRPAIKAMAVGFYLGFALAGCFLCFEILSDHAILFRLMAAFPSVWPQARTHLSEGALPPHFLNHRIAALAILLWPAAITAVRLGPTSRGRGMLLVGLGPSVVAIAASEHATSLVAMIAGACVVAISCWSWRTAQRLLMLAWVIACLAVVPLCLAAYAAGLQHLPWLAPSAQDRLVIWKATSDLIPDAPILGVGIHSGRPITRAEVERRIAPGTPFALSVGWHSHNAFLQVWFETGALGAGLLLGFGLLVLRGIGLQDRRIRPALFATFASCMMVAATGFSAFAPWLSASFAISALFAGLAKACSDLRNSSMGPTV
jgi:O-antigen ligase